MELRVLYPVLLALLLAIGAATIADAQARPNPALEEIEDVPGLPRVLLVGDSISIGYTIPVRKLLAGQANVHRPKVNCGPSSRGVEQLDGWLGEGKWDVIHVNFGLHDLVVEEGGKHRVPLEDYQKNLTIMFDRLAQTGAKQIWCATTPVPEGKLSPERHNSDVMAYNAAAAEIMAERKVPIDDLYSFALPRLAEIQLPNNVHFNGPGYDALAKEVARHLRAALGLEQPAE